MNVPEQLTCLFSTTVEKQDQSYVIEVPKDEVDIGAVDPTETHQLGILSLSETHESAPEPTQSRESPATRAEPEPDNNHDHGQPPVSEGDTRIVEIEEMGDQGDGLARVDRGFVVIVSDTERGERVKIEIETVRENVAFARVVERLDYYE